MNCSAIFVDIRKSSELPKKHKRPTLAKIYRTFISEVVAIINGDKNCVEINVEGDCVSGIFNTPYQKDINSTFSTAAKVSSIIDILNFKLKRKSISEIKVGIGLSFGRALMVKAGFKGSTINEIVWMGDVVNEASKLANKDCESSFMHPIMVSKAFYENLYEEHQKLLHSVWFEDYYYSEIVNTEMNDWYKENCKDKVDNWF